MKIYDLHNDYFTKLKTSKRQQTYLDNALKYTKNIATVVWTSEFNTEKSMQVLTQANKFCQNNSNTFLAIEDMHFLNKSNIYEIINMHPKYTGLTWNSYNNLAGGAYSTETFTDFGKFAVKTLENNDIFVDTAHLNERSFMDFTYLTTKPILCSHTASYQINNHPRNLKDYQIRIIADTGGLVGLCLVSDFLSGRKQCLLDDFVVHIDYLVNKFGIDYFSIGTDFNGTKHLPKGIFDYESLTSQLSLKLINLGYNNNDIEKLFYKNAEKFFK